MKKNELSRIKISNYYYKEKEIVNEINCRKEEIEYNGTIKEILVEYKYIKEVLTKSSYF